MKILTKEKETREDEHWTEFRASPHTHGVSSYLGQAISIYHIQYTMLIVLPSSPIKMKIWTT
jgi:hypothetical protein